MTDNAKRFWLWTFKTLYKQSWLYTLLDLIFKLVKLFLFAKHVTNSFPRELVKTSNYFYWACFWMVYLGRFALKALRFIFRKNAWYYGGGVLTFCLCPNWVKWSGLLETRKGCLGLAWAKFTCAGLAPPFPASSSYILLTGPPLFFTTHSPIKIPQTLQIFKKKNVRKSRLIHTMFLPVFFFFLIHKKTQTWRCQDIRFHMNISIGIRIRQWAVQMKKRRDIKKMLMKKRRRRRKTP